MPTSSGLTTVAILGGGISGLSTAYHLCRNLGNKVRPIIIEESNRTGGWIQTVKRNKDQFGSFHYERGPRSIRPAGISGMSTLDLVEEIGLDSQVIYVPKTHPAALNRFMFAKEKLIQFPRNGMVLFRKQEPFRRALIFHVLRDIFRFRKRLEDDCLYDFFHRRFGKDIADYVIDPIVRGICAGDAKQISVKFLAKDPFMYEQKYGSVVLGFLINKWLSKGSDLSLPGEDLGIGLSKIALTSQMDNWSVWSLENGLESLPMKLEEVLTSKYGVTILKDKKVTSLRMGDITHPKEICEVDILDTESNETTSIECNQVVSTLPSKTLSEVLKRFKPSHKALWKTFETIDSIDVQVTNLMYDTDSLIKHDGFGFLVPSSEKSVPGLLGVVFDSCSFPQENKTILTCMARPGHGLDDVKTVSKHLKTTLGIQERPDDMISTVLKQCIPQYCIGHYEKVDAARKFIKASKLPLILAGASFDGVSVNDCIYSGRIAADHVAMALGTKEHL